MSVGGAEEPKSGSETAHTATTSTQGAELTGMPLMWAAQVANRAEAPVSAVLWICHVTRLQGAPMPASNSTPPAPYPPV